MEIKDMNLQEVNERLAALDVEVRDMTDVEAVEKATEEKKALLERKAELEDFELRKAQADALAKEDAQPEKVIERSEVKKMEKTYGIDSEEYRSAWAKTLMGKELTEAEQRAYATTDAANAVPTILSDKFFEKMKKLAPMISEITLFRAAGNLKFTTEGVRTTAEIHTENTTMSIAPDTVVNVSLGGEEFTKVISMSQATLVMSVPQFEDWLVNLLSGDIARFIDNYIINGATGGIVAMVSTSTTNKITQTATSGYGYKDLIKLVGLLPAAYDAEAKFLINKTVLWNDILAITDNNNRPIFDPVEKKLLGYDVIVDDYVPTNHKQVYLGKWADVVGNLAQDVKVDKSAESGFLRNATDYRGSAIFDSKLAKNDAIVWLANA